METQLEELNRKIDALTEQVTYLTERARETRLAQESRQDFIESTMPIARRIMDIASEELVGIQDYLEPANVIRLTKKIILHAPQLEVLLDQLDSAFDLADVLEPITKNAVEKTSSAMEDLERKGYFGFARGGLRMVDNVVTHFTEEDVNRLGDNIVLILNTLKDMTQPEILNFVRNTLLIAEEEVQKPVDISMFSLMKQLRDPAVRRGLALTMRVLHVVGDQAAANGN